MRIDGLDLSLWKRGRELQQASPIGRGERAWVQKQAREHPSSNNKESEMNEECCGQRIQPFLFLKKEKESHSIPGRGWRLEEFEQRFH